MANYVRCELEAKNCGKERFEQICEFVKSEKILFDLDKIIPQPEELDIPEGSMNKFFKDLFMKYSDIDRHSLTEPFNMSDEEAMDILHSITTQEFKQAQALYGEFELPWEKIPDIAIAKLIVKRGWQYFHNRVTYFCETWYDWRRSHWETTRTSDIALLKDGLGWSFLVPWSAPCKPITVLSKIFPEVLFELRYADKDLSDDGCGIVTFVDGGAQEIPFQKIDESFYLACRLWGLNPTEVIAEFDRD